MLSDACLSQNLALPLTVVHVVRRQILLVLAVQLSHSHLLHFLWYAKSLHIYVCRRVCCLAVVHACHLLHVKPQQNHYWPVQITMSSLLLTAA